MRLSEYGAKVYEIQIVGLPGSWYIWGHREEFASHIRIIRELSPEETSMFRYEIVSREEVPPFIL